jgi:hypothetical protein
MVVPPPAARAKQVVKGRESRPLEAEELRAGEDAEPGAGVEEVVADGTAAFIG